MRLNGYLLASALVAALGGLLFGFDTAVISGTNEALTRVFHLDQEWLGYSGEFWLGFTVSSALIGTIFGSLIAGRPSETFGRRPVLLVIAVLYLISSIGSAFPWNWGSFLFFRFMGGLAIGGASVVSPLYIAEISPAKFRGRLVALTQFNIVFGILLAFLSNYLIHTYMPSDDDWRWMFGVVAIPSAIFFAMLFITPNSPRWLMVRNRDAEARAVFVKLGAEDVDGELRDIRQSLDLAHHDANEPFFCKKYLRPILLAVAVAMFNQLSGINALMYYAPKIFRLTGASQDSALLLSVILGVTNLVFTLAAMIIIDHFGRRKLLLVGAVGYILSLGLVTGVFYKNDTEFRAVMESVDATDKLDVLKKQHKAADPALLSRVDVSQDMRDKAHSAGIWVLIGILAFQASHAFGQGAVIWVFISEIFPNRVRASGQALGSFTHWFMAAAISWTFPLIAAKSGANAFAFYTVMAVVQLFWVLFVMPETKGISLEEIQRQQGIA